MSFFKTTFTILLYSPPTTLNLRPSTDQQFENMAGKMFGLTPEQILGHPVQHPRPRTNATPVTKLGAEIIQNSSVNQNVRHGPHSPKLLPMSADNSRFTESLDEGEIFDEDLGDVEAGDEANGECSTSGRVHKRPVKAQKVGRTKNRHYYRAE